MMKRLIRNKGIVILGMLLIVVTCSIVFDCVSRALCENEAKDIITKYVNNNISGDYMSDICEVYDNIEDIKSWEGQTQVRWMDAESRLVVAKTKIEYNDYESMNVNEAFVISKIDGNWKVSSHKVIKNGE